MRLRRWTVLFAALWAVHLAAGTASAADVSDTLLLYNAASADGIAIRDHYLEVHPGVQTLGITGLGTSENISADDFLSIIRPQVLAKVNQLAQDPQNPVAIDQFVTTKGMPLRVTVTEPQPSPNIINWQPYSSLESELTSIDTISTWQMMGDQSWQVPGNYNLNPYYNATTSFSHAEYGTRLAARLDGYTVADVNAAIDRAQHVFIGPSGDQNGPAHFVVDDDPAQPYDLTMSRLVNNVLTPAGMPLTYDDTSAFVATSTGPVIGYDSHGVHQASTPANYITDGLNLTLANGAVFTSIESYNAYSFNEGGYSGNQGQVAQWLQIGGTAGVGNVQEPTASWVTLSNEDILFRDLMAGMTFGEAAWAANYELSFVNTVIGDPLMTWHTLTYGDINEDGRVNISDLVLMSNHWGQTVAPGGYSWTVGDLNGDGHVDISDLVLLSNHWGQVSSWGAGPSTAAEISPQAFVSVVESMLHPVPEPASCVLLGAGIAALLVCRTRLASRRATVRSGSR